MARVPKPLLRPASTSSADVKAFVDVQLARAKATMAINRRGHLKVVKEAVNPLEAVVDQFSGDPIDDLNTAVRAIGEHIAADTGPATPETGTAEPVDPVQAAKVAGNKRRAAATAAVWKRTTDRSFYFCVVFDSGGQAKAFLDALRLQGKLMQDGDLFIDGRNLADALGIKIPDPEYPMTVNLKEPKNSRTKRMQKIGKG